MILNEFKQELDSTEIIFKRTDNLLAKVAKIVYENYENYDFHSSPLGTRIYSYLDAFELRGQSDSVLL